MGSQKYKRVLLKLSGETLLPSDSNTGIDFKAAKNLSLKIKRAVLLKTGMGIVIGGGNIFRGMGSSETGVIRSRSDVMGMLATSINSLALQTELEKAGVPVSIYSAVPVIGALPPMNREEAFKRVDNGEVVIFAGGTGNPFFSTDTAAVLRALEISADAILKGTKVDGVYDADPMKVKGAKKFDELTYIDALKRGLKIMDASAISMCMDHKIPIVVFNMFVDDNLEKVIRGEKVGTVIK